MSGHDLFEILINSTGLNGHGIRNEVLAILKQNNLSIEDLNINTLREIMEDYLISNLPNKK